MKVIVAGDFCEKDRVADQISRENYAGVFGEVKPVLESVDFSIVNFEFPIVDDTSGHPIEKCGPALKGGPKSVEAIKYAGFNICTLANNHILDQGCECCLSTRNLLERNGLRCVGVGENLSKASEILHLEKDGERLAVINCCEHEFSIATANTPGANPLNPIRQFYEIKKAKESADHVMVIVHGGHEHCPLPSPRMQEIYRYFIDSGADVVVNHHQHCYSGYENYHKGMIFYGLGNFCFDWDGRRNKLWNEGFLLKLIFVKGAEVSFKLIPYIQCEEKPSVCIMSNIQEENFENQICELNNIINNDCLLQQEYERWLHTQVRYVNQIFLPYNSRISKGLYLRNLLPAFLPKNKRLMIINYLNTESHLDLLRFSVEHFGE